MQLEEGYVVEIIKLVQCVDSKEDPLIQTVRARQHNINSAVLQTARRLKRGTRQINDSIAEKTKERWREKNMHGQCPRNLDENLVDNEQSYRWLKFRGIKGETESTVLVTQDQSVSTEYLKM
jgi:hypothetical protein